MWVYIVTYLVTGGTIVCFFSKRWPSILVGFAFLLIVPLVAAAVFVKAFTYDEPTDSDRADRLAWFLAKGDRAERGSDEFLAEDVVRSRIRESWDPTWDGPSFPLDESGWPLDEFGRKVQLSLLSEPDRVEVRTGGADGVVGTKDDVVAVADICWY